MKLESLICQAKTYVSVITFTYLFIYKNIWIASVIENFSIKIFERMVEKTNDVFKLISIVSSKTGRRRDSVGILVNVPVSSWAFLGDSIRHAKCHWVTEMWFIAVTSTIVALGEEQSPTTWNSSAWQDIAYWFINEWICPVNQIK